MSSLKENKMGTMPIGRLLLTMALPMALSMLVQALYNVVDSAFVAKISDVNQDALNAVSLAFPVQNIMIGIATGTAVGVNALLSRALGERDADMVNRSALNGVFLAGLGMLLSALFGIFCAELFMRSQTSNEAVIAYGTAYIRIITIASFGIFGEIIFERLLQSTGRTRAVLFLLPVLAHHNKRSLNGSHAGQHQIQQNERIGVECLCSQQDIEDHPRQQYARERKNECPASGKFCDAVRRALTERGQLAGLLKKYSLLQGPDGA